MAKAVPAPAIEIPLKTLTGLLGKKPKDPEVIAAMAECGKVTWKPDFIIAKEAGFDVAVGTPTGGKHKVLETLFLFAEGNDKHRGFRDLPQGFSFGTRGELLATFPAPDVSWVIGEGKVDVSHAEVDHDTWNRDGLEITAHYRDNAVRYYTVSLPEEATGGRDLTTNALGFETKPADAPDAASLVGSSLLVAWAIEKHGLPAKHASSSLGKQLTDRAITPRAFLVGACGSTLSTLDVNPKLGDFLYNYTHRLFTSPDDARKAQGARIAELLRTESPDRRYYSDDFLGTFAHAVASPFYVPDSWDALDRIAPVLDARWADFQATGFAQAADLALYEQAATLRDARSVTEQRAQLATATIDDGYADALLATIGTSLKEAATKAVVTRGGMPVGKRIDQQANPALGVSYMGTNIEVNGKKVLGVESVWFYTADTESYIRGIGAKVKFLGYPAALPRGLAFGETRAAVTARLGTPSYSRDASDGWTFGNHTLYCTFADDKLVEVRAKLV